MSNENEDIISLDFPESSRQLLELLNIHFPPRCIQHNEEEIHAHRYAGMRELIDELIVWQEEADEESNPSVH